MKAIQILLSGSLLLFSCVNHPESDDATTTDTTTYKLTDAQQTLELIDTTLDALDPPRGNDWLTDQKESGLLVARSRISGSVTDLVAAGDAIDRAFDRATEGTGPFMARANYSFLVHDVTAVERDLQRVEQKILIQDDERAEIAGLRGDVAFHTANLDQAEALYRDAEEREPSMASAARLGNFAVKTGDYDAARLWYELAIERVPSDSPSQKAWAYLHRGIVELEADKVEDAMTWYQKANDTFSGWYLVQEHIAEGRLLLGDPEGALRIYQDVLVRVPNGEFYGAIAETYDTLNDERAARDARASAVDAFDRDLEALASAAGGHAIDFFIDHDPARAVTLAEQNFQLRPSYESRVKLAAALLANGERADARETLEPMLNSRWRTPDFLDLKNELF